MCHGVGMARQGYKPEPAITDMQERFARGLVAGLSQTEAARIAGYSAPMVTGVALSRSEAVRARVKALRTNEIDKLASLSLRVLRSILTKPSVSDAVRLNAVKLTLGMAGHTEKPSDEVSALKTKDISGMSLAELDAFLLAEKNKRADASKPVIDQVMPQAQDNPLNHNDKAEPFAGSALLIEGDCVAVYPPSAEGEP